MAGISLRDVGAHFRRLRERRSVSGRELARLCDVNQTRLSKFERGVSLVTADELRRMLRTLEVGIAVEEQLLDQLRIVSKPAKPRPGVTTNDPLEQFKQMERRASTIDMHVCRTLPSLLQMPEYSIEVVDRFAGAGMGEKAVKTRLERQTQLWSSSKHFCFLLSASALTYRPVPDDALWREQLWFVMRRTSLPNVAIRVVDDPGRFPWGEFVIYDTKHVCFGLPNLSPALLAPADGVHYVNAFREMWLEASPLDEHHIEAATHSPYVPRALPVVVTLDGSEREVPLRLVERAAQ
jgi:transcriptional regulator with XRE-family HTH domain